MTVLEVQIEALARLAPQLGLLAALVDGAGASTAPAAGEADSPSLAAVRAVSNETFPDLRGSVADRFTAVGNAAQRVATTFETVSGSMTDHSVAVAMTSSGSLLPSRA